MIRILFASFIMFIAFSTVNAHALQWQNCSNANGDISIIEHEVWGANPIGCYFHGDELRVGVADFDRRSVRVLEERGPRFPRGDEIYSKTFAIKVKIKNKDGSAIGKVNNQDVYVAADWLICKLVKNGALDFVPINRSCEINGL